MTWHELQRLIKGGETEQVEFKQKADHPDKVVKELVAFANTAGGHLFIGVDDNGKVTGVKDAEEKIYAMEHAIGKLCKPALKYSITTVPLNRSKREVVVFRVDESSQKPHFVIENFRTRRGKAYFRVDDQSIQASRELRQIIKRRRQEREVGFAYGQKEQQLLQFLNQHPAITLNAFAELCNISREEASETLIVLVLADILKIAPNGDEDNYTMNEAATIGRA